MITQQINQTKIKFDPDAHEYHLNGHTLPSVTTITGIIDKSGPLMGWAVNETVDAIREEWQPGVAYDEVQIEDILSAAKRARFRNNGRALNIGTLVHNWINEYIEARITGANEKPELPVNDQAKEAIKEFLRWESQQNVTWTETERIVYNPKGYAGTLDAEALVDGERVVVDFKTSSGIYEEHHLQATAYLAARRIENGKEYAGYTVLRCPKDKGEFEAKTVTDTETLQKNYEGFLGPLRLHNWKNGNGVT